MEPAYPFYSRIRGIGVVDVYHSHPACQIARSIAPGFRRPGNPLGWPECMCCQSHWVARPRPLSPPAAAEPTPPEVL